MRLDVVNQTGRPVPGVLLRRVTRRATKEFRLPTDTAVTVFLVTDRRIRQLNLRTRKVNTATDVLAFPLHHPHAWRRAPVDPDGVRRLGDVLVSLDTARRQAAQRGNSLREEVAVLFAHGLLHLMGYDHRTRRAETRMAALTQHLIS